MFLRHEFEYATIFETRSGGKVGSFIAPSAHLQLETDVLKGPVVPALHDFRKLKASMLVEMGAKLLAHS